MTGKKIVVWFSCGAASAVAAKATIDRYGKRNQVIVVNSFIKQEDADNRRFLSDVEKWIGQPIVSAINKNYPTCSCTDVWSKRRYMSGTNGAPCTGELKKEARYQWTEINNPDWHVLGFAFDEKRRHKLFTITEIPNIIPVLIDEEIDKEDCYDIVQRAGILLPLSYRQGYNNANCKGCVKATSPTYWNHVRKTDPDVFEERAIQSREIGCRLTRVKGKRIFLDELDPNAKGRPMKKLKNIDCGIFCEVPIK